MRTKRIMMSTLAEIIPYLLIGVLGIFKVRFLIANLGDIANGYYQFINSTITYIFMAEAGFGSAVAYYLYKLFAYNDKEQIKKIFLGSRKIFRNIGFIITALIILVAVVLPIFFIEHSEFDLVVTLSFLLISGSYLLAFFGPSNSYRAIFNADQKSYLYSLIFNAFKIISDLLIIIVIILTKELLSIAIVIVIVKILEQLVMSYVGRKKYPYLKDAKEADTTPVKMTKDLVWHQFGYLAANNIDAVILMLVNGPFVVSIYTSYNFILRFLKQIASKIDSIVMHSFGNVYVLDNKEKAYNLFKEYSSFCTLMAFSFSLTFLIGIRPFVIFWIGDILYSLPSRVIIMFALNLFLMIIYLPLVSSINSNGLYKESKFYIFAGAMVNLVLSIIFVNLFGIGGILLATAISYLVIIVLRARLVKKEIFPDVNLIKMISRYFLDTGLFLLAATLLMKVESFMLGVDSLILLIIYLGISFAVIAIISVVIMTLFGNNIVTTLKRVKTLRKKA